MTDREKRLILRGMSVARGLLMGGARCEHHGFIQDYQKALAEAWKIDEGDALHRAEFEQLVEEINEAIEAKHPDWISTMGRRGRRHGLTIPSFYAEERNDEAHRQAEDRSHRAAQSARAGLAQTAHRPCAQTC